MTLTSHSRPFRFQPCAWIGAAAVTVAVADVTKVHAQQLYRVTPLVSDGSVNGTRTDTALINPWGIVAGSSGPMWINNNGTGTSVALDSQGAREILVTVPGTSTDAPSTPTGIVFNGTNEFQVEFDSGTAKAVFLFATQEGLISAFNPAVQPGNNDQTVTVVDDSDLGAQYTGLALLPRTQNRSRLFAADFSNDRVAVFDGTFTPLTLTTDAFQDSEIPDSFAPFNVAIINGRVFVAFAENDGNGDEVVGKGKGFIDVFNAKGRLLQRLVKGGHLNAPWAMTVAPSNFGPLSNALLVGSFGNGRIHAFDVGTGDFISVMRNRNGKRIFIDGLWGMTFGNGDAAGSRNTLFFASGPDEENGGLYGKITLTSASLGADEAAEDSRFSDNSVDDEDDLGDGQVAQPVDVSVNPAAAPVAGTKPTQSDPSQQMSRP